MKNRYSKKIKKSLKLIFVNINVLILLIFYISFLTVSFYEIYKTTDISTHGTILSRYKEETHIKYDWAKQYFEDEFQVKGEYHAFVGYKERPFSSETINIDNDGYRISRNNSDKPDIYFLGGSTMFGYGSDDMNSIPSLFSKLTDDSLSVRNMGNADHSSTQSLLKIHEELISHPNPKYIISYEGVNELVSLTSGMDSNLKQGYYNDFKRAIDENLNNQSSLTFESFFKNRFTQIRDFTFLSLRKLRVIEYKSIDEMYLSDRQSVEKAVTVLLENWRLISLIGDAKNIKVYLFLQPQLSSNDHKSDYLQDIETYATFYQKLYPLILSEIETNPNYEIIEKNFYDLSKVLDNKNPYFYDHCHLNPDGNLIIAQSMVKNIFK
tara:strand:+ start:2182 stop:3321 length:1140 start_codon:yes stop_codon:yes gene_type:complete